MCFGNEEAGLEEAEEERKFEGELLELMALREEGHSSSSSSGGG